MFRIMLCVLSCRREASDDLPRNVCCSDSQTACTIDIFNFKELTVNPITNVPVLFRINSIKYPLKPTGKVCLVRVSP